MDVTACRSRRGLINPTQYTSYVKRGRTAENAKKRDSYDDKGIPNDIGYYTYCL